MNLENFLVQQNVSVHLEEAVISLSQAIIETSELIERAPIQNQLGTLDQENIQGEKQTELDVLSNNIFLNSLEKTTDIIGVVSEEINNEIVFDKQRRENQLIVFFDPLDGSSNVSSNISVGSIFSVYTVAHTNKIEINDFLQKGNKQVAAGFSVLGPSTLLVLTLGHGTFKFCLDRNYKQFLCVEKNIKIPEEAEEFAINMSNKRFWSEAVNAYVHDCQLGKEGPRKKNFNMRWVASLVADINRILTRGGIYLYPKDNKRPEKTGRLRLMYEINPMAFIIEQCCGACTNGLHRILDFDPEDIHQRVPVVIGAKKEVDVVSEYYQHLQ